MQRHLYISLLLTLILAGVLAPARIHSQNITKPNIIGPEGLEVNSFTGNLYYQRQDYQLRGLGLNIDLAFHYNSSRRDRDEGFGFGWTFAWDLSYEDMGDSLILLWGDGREDIYEFGGGQWQPPVGVFDTLTEYQPNQYCLRTKAGNRYYFDEPAHRQLTRLEDPNGNQLLLTYLNGELEEISENGGRSLQFSWANGHLAQVLDQNGSSPRLFDYTYDSDSLLRKVSNPLSHEYSFRYGQDRELVSVIDPVGNPLDIIYNANFAVKRLVSCFTDHRISYNPANRKTYVIERTPQGNVMTTYLYDQDDRIQTREGNCCGYNQTFAYDADNNVSQRTDANGHVYLYSYDSRGNRLSILDPLGGSVGFSYDPVYNRLLSRTDQNGHTTSYQYDGQGNLTQINYPLGLTESFTYNAAGNQTSHTNKRGFVTSFVYDPQGNLIQVDQADTTSLFFQYDAWGNLTQQVNAKGDTTHYAYDDLNRLIRMTDALGHLIHYAYDAKGNRISEMDPRGILTLRQYDVFDRLVAVKQPYGITTRYAYDARNNLIAETDPQGHITRHTYDEYNRRTSTTDAMGKTVFFAYDGNGNLITRTDALGHTTSYSYDALDRRVGMSDALGNFYGFSYDAAGNLNSNTDANGNTTTYAYDALNRQISRTDALNQTSYSSYDANNNRISETDANGNTSYFQYDALDRLTVVINAAGDTVLFVYDDNGNQVAAYNAMGHQNQMVYNALDQLVQEINPEGDITAYHYDAAGNRDTVYYPNGNVMAFQYDSLNRIRQVIDQDGALVQYGFDKNSNPLFEINGVGDSIQYAYDALNRRIQISDGLGQTSFTYYDANGNVIEEINRNQQLSSYTYDVLNRLLTETDPLGQITAYTYDGLGNVLTITDARGNVTSYTYDALNRQTSEQLADGANTIFSYDAVGNQTSLIRPGGQTINYVYNNLNQLVQRQSPSGNHDQFGYDAAGRMITATNNDAVVSYLYDDADRVLEERLNNQPTAYSYDIANGLRTITYPGGRQVTEEYNERGLLTEIKESGASLASFSYDAASRLSQRNYANGTTTNWTYNANDQITDLVHAPGGFLQFHYEYDGEGNRLSAEKLHRPTHSESYTYDALQRLTDFSVGTLVGGSVPNPLDDQLFQYDEVGNRTQATLSGQAFLYQANAVNQYTLIGGPSQVVPSHDLRGNLVNDGTYQFNYDLENRLLSADSAGNNVVSYKYGPLGRRVEKAVGGQVTRYFYVGSSVIEEQDNAGTTLATYVYGSSMDDILSMDRASNRYFYHHNALGSVVALTSATGSVVERYAYSAYGLPQIMDASYNALSGSAVGNDYLFTGRRWEAEIGKYYYRARYYDPKNGRFMQRDPLGYVDGMNAYEYVRGNPVNFVDPMGLFSLQDAILSFLKPKKGCYGVDFAVGKRIGRALRRRGVPKILARLVDKLARGILDVKVKFQICGPVCDPDNCYKISGGAEISKGVDALKIFGQVVGSYTHCDNKSEGDITVCGGAKSQININWVGLDITGTLKACYSVRDGFSAQLTYAIKISSDKKKKDGFFGGLVERVGTWYKDKGFPGIDLPYLRRAKQKGGISGGICLTGENCDNPLIDFD